MSCYSELVCSAVLGQVEAAGARKHTGTSIHLERAASSQEHPCQYRLKIPQKQVKKRSWQPRVSGLQDLVSRAENDVPDGLWFQGRQECCRCVRGGLLFGGKDRSKLVEWMCAAHSQRELVAPLAVFASREPH